MGDMRNAYKILVGKPKGKILAEDLGVDGKIILEWILEKSGGENVDWIHVAQYRDQWRAVVNTIMNLRVQLKVDNSLSSFSRWTDSWS